MTARPPLLDAGSPQAIADHALLSDCQGAALVDRTGTVSWACLPRFDSPSTFGRIVGSDAGHWRICPTRAFTTERSYLEGTMVLRTIFRTDRGTVAVTDAMPFDPDERGHSIGRVTPGAVIRVVEGLDGRVELDVELAPRPEYGLTRPLLFRDSTQHGVRSRGGPMSYVVSSDIELELGEGTASARPTVTVGQKLAFALRVCSPWADPPAPWTGREVQRMLRSTVEGWRSWSTRHQRYSGPYAEQVHLSGRVLRALTHVPSGAVVAAPTTSLPEAIGGGRNWDYRYTWVRDASLTLEALWVAACPDEAQRFFDFFVTAAGGEVERAGAGLQVMYGVGGERSLDEHELDHLTGYRGSRPVRVGNGAWSQSQLDIYGELLSAAWVLSEQLGELDGVTASFLASLADQAVARWEEADQGIWEVRGGPQHFVYSKLMCWVAVDRALKMGLAGAASEQVKSWEEARHRIRTAILEQGWSDEAGAYAQALGSAELDASVLMMAVVGFLPADDERMRSTIEAVARGLIDERGMLQRYQGEDGLEGGEGSFGICTFWLVQCFAMLGDLDRAHALFRLVAGHANDVGLLAEEFGADGEQLGNFPQAFTHIGLVNAAYAIAKAQGEV